MKSAYELAMERLKASDPEAGAPLTPDQKARLADIERVYQAKIAEREIFLKKQLGEAQDSGQREELEKIAKQLTNERARLTEEMEEEKENARRKFRADKT